MCGVRCGSEGVEEIDGINVGESGMFVDIFVSAVDVASVVIIFVVVVFVVLVLSYWCYRN